jgi:hypothetical protein
MVAVVVALVAVDDSSSSSHLSGQSGVQRVQTLGALDVATDRTGADDSGAFASGEARWSHPPAVKIRRLAQLAKVNERVLPEFIPAPLPRSSCSERRWAASHRHDGLPV